MAKKKQTLADYSPLAGLAQRREKDDASYQTNTLQAVEDSSAVIDRKQTHTQISAFIPRALYKSVKQKLAGRDDKMTLTDLLIKLLSDWEREQK